MEGTPMFLDYTEIMETFLNIDGVVRVHNLRIWVRDYINLKAHRFYWFFVVVCYYEEFFF